MTERQIEEMTKVIRSILESRTDIVFIPDLDKPIAEELIKYYQPKLPEDSVVLTERQHEIAMIHQYDVGFSFGYKQARKEIAKEFAQTLISLFWEEEEGETVRRKDVQGVIRDVLRAHYKVEIEL